MDDENRRKILQASNMIALQNKAQEYQKKIEELQKKDYTCSYQGVTIKMKGDNTVMDVSISQTVYETSGKSQLELALKTAYNKLLEAIEQERNELQQAFQDEIKQLQTAAMMNDGQY